MIRSASGLRRLTDADVLIIQGGTAARTACGALPARNRSVSGRELDYCALEKAAITLCGNTSAGLAWDGNEARP